jgi:hypothetical protein
LEHLSVDGRIILKWVFKKRDGWTDLAFDREKWWAL